MIYKLKVQQVENIKGDKPQKMNWKNTLFFNDVSQYACCYLTGYQGSGKSQTMLNIIDKLGDKKHTQIFWISSVAELDRKVQEQLKGYNIQYFQQKDVQNGLFEKLFNYLKDKRKKNDMEKKNKTEKYIQNFVIMDDIVLDRNTQMQLQILLKTYRHIKTFIASLTQDFVSQNVKMLRNLYQIQILYQGINNDRMKECIYKQLRCKMNWETFEQLYEIATKDRYNFLCIASKKMPVTFQQNFDYIYVVKEDEE